MKKMLLLLSIALLSACGSAGKNFNEQALVQLQPGMTSYEEVRQLLGGQPVKTVERGDGSTLRQWFYAWAGLWTISTKEVAMLFDDQDRFVQILILSDIELPAEERERLAP